MKKKRTKEKKPVRAIPLPEAIDGERWEIHQANSSRLGGIAVQENHMVVPMGDNEKERAVRAHEMVHVSITPRERALEVISSREVDDQILNLCEDARVHSQMTRLGFSIGHLRNLVSDQEIADAATKAHPATLAALAAAMCLTGEQPRLGQKIADAGDDERTYIWQYGHNLALYRIHEQGELPDFETVIEMAKEIQEMLGDPREPDPPPPPPVPPCVLPTLGPPPDPKHELPPLKFEKNTKRPVQNPGKGPWKEVVFEEPPRPVKFPARMRGRNKRKPYVRGRRLHRIGRLYTDGYVFGDRPPSKGGGAILIDTSGSMSLTTEEVLQLCVVYPGGIIAAYSSMDVGYLRVIAKNGKRVQTHMLTPPGSGNGIDGPALDWLATQRGPRFWISDAGVEGGVRGLRYCLDVCKRFNITRVDNAWDIVGKHFDE